MQKKFFEALKAATGITGSQRYKGLLMQVGVEKALEECYKTFGSRSGKVIEAYFESRSKETFWEWLKKEAKLATQYRIINS
ncbi:MAG: hypothetical protein QW035_01205 [Candidatus Anstonellales archaeon]